MQAPEIAWVQRGVADRHRRRRPAHRAGCGGDFAPGAAGLAACAIAGAHVALVSGLVRDARQVARRPSARRPTADTAALGFRRARRTLGVFVYDPLRRVPPAAIPPLLGFVAGPEGRRERTGVDLLYGARWALPAGRYDMYLDGRGGTVQGEIGLQVGRHGPPLRTWTIEPAARWRATIDLPANANFVGFRASPELTAAAPALR